MQILACFGLFTVQGGVILVEYTFVYSTEFLFSVHYNWVLILVVLVMIAKFVSKLGKGQHHYGNYMVARNISSYPLFTLDVAKM